MAKKKSSSTRRPRKAKDTRSLPEDIKSLQRTFRRLKKLGLTKSKKPATQKNVLSKFVKNLFEKFKPVIEGKTAAVKLSPKAARQYKRAGFETHGTTVLVEKELPNEKIYKSHSKAAPEAIMRKRDSKSGKATKITEIIPQKFTDLESYFEDLIEHPEKAGHRPPRGRYAFRYHGNSTKIAGGFGTVQSMVHFLRYYSSIAEALDHPDRKKQDEVFKNLEFYTITEKEAKEQVANVDVFRQNRMDATGRNTGKSRQGKVSSAEKRRRQKERSPEAYRRYLDKQAAAATERRKRLKNKD